MKRVFSLLLLLGLLCSLTACGSQRDVPEVMPKQDFGSEGEVFASGVFDAAPETVEYPLTETSEPISITVAYSSELAMEGDRRLLEDWENATGIILEENPVPQTEYFTMLNQNIAGGCYTDIMWSLPEYAFGEDMDICLELSDLIRENAPNYIAAVNGLPGGPQAVTEEDGRLCRMCQLLEEPQLLSGYGLALRQDFLEELDMDPPETYVEYHDYFLAVKDKYQADQPLRLPPEVATGCNNLNAGFDISLGSRTRNHGFYQIDGTIHFGPLEPGFTDYVTMLSQWYREGIINAKFLDVMDTGSNSYLIDVANHTYGGFFLPMGSWDTVSGMCEFPLTPGMDPVQNPGETTHLAAAPATIIYGSGFSISTECQDPALAVQALDWLYSEAGFLSGSYGREDESYTMVNGAPEYTELIQNNPEGLSMADALASYTGTDLSGITGLENLSGQMGQVMELLEVWNRQKDDGFMLPEGVKLTQEDSEDYTARAADISTYVDSLLPQLVTGEKPLEEIPQIQEEILEMGAEECIALWQTALDRYQGAK